MKTDEMVSLAVEKVQALTGFEPGAEIRTSDMLAALGLEECPDRGDGESDRAYVKRCKRDAMKAIGPIEALRERLLTAHKVDIKATGRGSYRIVPPGVQAPQAAKEGAAKARKALREAAVRIENVDVSKLSGEQRADREASMLNNAARLGMLSGRSTSKVLEEARTKSAEAPKSGVPMPSRETAKRP
jgi:hypothetical protein